MVLSCISFLRLFSTNRQDTKEDSTAPRLREVRLLGVSPEPRETNLPMLSGSIKRNVVLLGLAAPATAGFKIC